MAAIMCGLVATVCGCATVYQPTTARPVSGPGVVARITSVVAARRKAVVAVHSDETATIESASLASADQPPCTSPEDLAILDAPTTLRGDGELEVQLPGNRSAARPGLFVDLAVATARGDICLRLPLTGVGDETLWAATTSPYEVALELRADVPTGPVGGVGIAWTGAARVSRQLGAVRGFVALPFGWATCRRDCPDFTYESTRDSLEGFFVHLGLEAGLERRIAFGHSWVDLGLGVKATWAHLAAGDDFTGDRNAPLLGPMASLRLGFASRLVPGFSPPDRSGHGPELLVTRLTAIGRGPLETSWVVSGGWSWTFAAPCEHVHCVVHPRSSRRKRQRARRNDHRRSIGARRRSTLR